MHAGRLLPLPIELLTRERRLDKGLLLQRTRLFPLWWRAVVRRHDDGGCWRGRGGQGVGVHWVKARELLGRMQRQGRGQFVRVMLALLERVQRVQGGVRVRCWRPALDWNGGEGRLHGETGGAPLGLAVFWMEGSG